MKLHELAPAPGAKKKRKRIGRGPGSGHGKTATKGHKGLLARSGGGKRPGFEGGQMPLVRRIPKHGFQNPFRTEYAIVNLKSLATLSSIDPITPQALVDAGLIKRTRRPVKILGQGELGRAVVIQAHKFSQSAVTKIEAAGGRAEVIGGV
ncbi:MAG: 50S ribosomal protein L15 [Nitrospirota bacterium]|nr:50S ribosomal protein L15 [Nitrospirota bacterium]MDE3120053.1 50S ribosomal protein L15 [Nitrospirota bacterium]MDE3223832.1 50S ribosomal protein L15 [Nitrospirota bacterium]MDE3242894.1 50S ribosomal protein L15 [Nitrospirota bacterium]